MRQTPLTMRLNNFFRLRIFIVTPFPNFNLFGYLSKMKGKQKLKVFSIGYQGVSQQDYIEALIEAGVGMVIDVREHPWSQRPEFIKSLLQKALADHNIDYVHIRSAGNPSINRKKAKTNSECLKLYGKYLSKHRECLSDLLEFIKVAAKSGSPACLTCYEHLPEECHRSILLEFLGEIQELNVTHLHPVKPEQKRLAKTVGQTAVSDTTNRRL